MHAHRKVEDAYCVPRLYSLRASMRSIAPQTTSSKKKKKSSATETAAAAAFATEEEPLLIRAARGRAPVSRGAPPDAADESSSSDAADERSNGIGIEGVRTRGSYTRPTMSATRRMGTPLP